MALVALGGCLFTLDRPSKREPESPVTFGGGGMMGNIGTGMGTVFAEGTSNPTKSISVPVSLVPLRTAKKNGELM